MSTVSDWASNMISTTKSTYSSNSIKNILSGSTNELTSKYSDLIKSRNILDLIRAASAMGQTYSNDGSSILDDVSNGVSGAKDAFTSLTSSFQNQNNVITSILDKASTELFGKNTGDIASGMSSVKDSLKQGISSSGTTFTSVSNALSNMSVEKLTKLPISSLLSDAASATGFNTAFNSINFSNSNTDSNLQISLAGYNLGAARISYDNAVGNFLKNVSTGGISSAVSTAISASATSVTNLFSDFGSNFTMSGLSNLIDGMKSLVAGICSALSNFLNFDFSLGNVDLLSGLLAKLGKLLNALMNLIGSLLSIINKLIGMLGALINSILGIIAQLSLECMGKSTSATSLLGKCCNS